MRLFVAIDPPEVVRDALAALELPGRLSRVPRDQLHLTLRFLGEVERVPALDLASPPFSLRVVGGGAFPSAARPRVLWAGIGGDLDALAGLAARVEAAVRSVGLPPADKPFRAHLTLARVRGGRVPEAVAAVQALPDLGEWPVREVLLVKSTLGPRGAVHERMATFPLA